MSRLIDADALMSAVMAQDVMDKSAAKRLILQAPTVDAVPVMTYPQVDGLTPTVVATPDMVRVVRCGDCKHYDHYMGSSIGSGVCSREKRKMNPIVDCYWYCADGERKDDGDNH